MTIFGASGEQESRGLVVDIYTIVEDQLELVPASEFSIDREIHAVDFCGHRAFQFTGERTHWIHVIIVLLAIRNVPLGYHERAILTPIVPNVSHNLSNETHSFLITRRRISITA